MAHKDALLTDVDDPRLEELRERVRTAPPHVPAPGDDDYLTPEQIRWIQAGQPERRRAPRRKRG